MNIVFFPFSHVDRLSLKTMTTFFTTFRYLPLAADMSEIPDMAPWVEAHAVEPVFTPQADLLRVNARVREWLGWAARHRGNERNLKLLARQGPVFVMADGPSGIQSRIRSRVHTGERAMDTFSTPYDPLLFLAIARLTDVENDGVNRQLADLEATRSTLFSTLKGDPSPRSFPSPGIAPEDPGRIMTRERIHAWAVQARAHGLLDNASPRMLVTPSQAVFDWVASNSSEVINALDFDAIKVHEDGCTARFQWQKSLMDRLVQVIDAPGGISGHLQPASDGCQGNGQIQVGIFSGADLEKKGGLPGERLAVCRVGLEA